jgi:hypothetical protein
MRILVCSLSLLVAVQVMSAKDKEKFVDYHIHAERKTIETQLFRYFTQMGYVNDPEHTRQCNDHPTAGVFIFRHTGEGQSGIVGLSRCVIITMTTDNDISTLRVECYDHLRGGLTLPATKHYDADRIHKDWDAAFLEITRLSEGPAQ